jgi:hypothetical protein
VQNRALRATGSTLTPTCRTRRTLPLPWARRVLFCRRPVSDTDRGLDRIPLQPRRTRIVSDIISHPTLERLSVDTRGGLKQPEPAMRSRWRLILERAERRRPRVVRQREMVAVYHLGYLDGLRDGADGVTPDAHAAHLRATGILPPE